MGLVTYASSKKSESVDDVSKRTYISSLDLQNITLDKPLSIEDNEQWDTDEDGLTDWQEVLCKDGLITGNSTDGFVLPTYEKYLKIAVSIEELEGIEDFLRNKLDGSSYQYVKNIKVLPLISDPTKEDTDGDGLNDAEDENPLEFIKNHKLKEKEKSKLKKSLLKQIEKDIAFTTWIKSLHSAEYCVDTVINYDDIITEYANIYKMPKAYIQSVLLRELYCYGLDDPSGDLGFMNYCMYNRECEFYYSQSDSYQQLTPAPKMPLIYKEDASTGIGQISTYTALSAHNYAVDRGLKKEKLDNNWSNREKLFYNLKDDVYSIDMIALVLMYGWHDNMDFIDSYTEKYWSLSVDQKKTMFTIYNCGETCITEYGKAVYNLYEIFEKYQ